MLQAASHIHDSRDFPLPFAISLFSLSASFSA